MICSSLVSEDSTNHETPSRHSVLSPSSPPSSSSSLEIPQVLSIGTKTIVDTHLFPTLELFRPDITIYSNNIQSVSDIVAVIDVKSQRGAKKTNAEQMWKYAQEILIAQPLRNVVLCMVLDRDGFTLCRFTRRHSPLSFQSKHFKFASHVATYPFEDALNVLWAFLNSDEISLGYVGLDSLGFSPSIAQDFVPHSLLGDGSSGFVTWIERRDTFNRTSLAVKHFTSSNECKAEVDVLQTVRASSTFPPDQLTCIPEVVEVAQSGLAFAMSPVGSEISNLTSQHVIDAVDLLEQLHKACIVHGDPRPPNLLLHPQQNKVMFVDFTFSRPIGDFVHPSHGVLLAPKDWLIARKANSKVQLKAAHDLEILVMHVFLRCAEMLGKRLFAKLEGFSPQDLLNWWDLLAPGILLPKDKILGRQSHLPKMLEAARTCTYQGLKILFADYVPDYDELQIMYFIGVYAVALSNCRTH